MKKWGIILWLALLFSSISVYSIDSLYYKISQLPDNDEKLDYLLVLCKNVQKDDFALGLEYCEECIAISEKLNRTSHRAWGHVYKAKAHELLGDYKTMAENYHEALDLFILIKDSAGMAGTYNKLGYVELRLKDYERAIDYFKNALHLAKYVPEDFKRAEFYVGLADVYIDQKLPDSAKQYLETAMTLVEDKPDELAKAKVFESMGKYYRSIGEYDSAFACYKRNILIIRGLGSRRLAIPALRNLGDLYCSSGDEAKSLHFLTEAIELSLQVRNKEELAKCYKVLANCYESRNDESKALYYYKLNEALQDAIFNEEKFKAMALVQARFEFNNKTRQMEAIQRESIGEERRIRYFWIVIALLTLGLSIVTWLAYRTKLRANEALKKQNDEKDVLIKEVHHRVKNNLQLINSLLNLQRDKVEDLETKKALTESSNRVKSMAMVHQKLYQEADVSRIDFEDYLNELIEYLATGLQPFDVQVKYNVECEKINFNLQTAIPLGLIINEVITNSLKYAFAARKTGTITIKAVNEPGLVFILVTDDGVGLPQDLDPSKSNTLGMHLIRLLARQIKAEIKVRTGKGTKFEIKLKPDE